MEYYREIYRLMTGEGRPLLIFFCGALLLILLVALVERLRIAKSPLRTVPAVVMNKRTSETTYHDTRASGARKSSTRRTYFVTFVLDDGEEVELVVPHISAMGVQTGDRGELTYQGPKYYAFDTIS